MTSVRGVTNLWFAFALILQGCNLKDVEQTGHHIMQSFRHLISGDGSSRTSLTEQGAEILLNVLPWGNGMRLLVSVSLVDSAGNSAPPQELILDTGSSTLAFCDNKLAAQFQSEITDLASCNMYNPGGARTGYWGYFYRGTVDIGSSIRVESAYFSVMESEVQMPCRDGFNGIFGIAFKQLDAAFNTASSAMQKVISSEATACPHVADAALVEPLMQSVKASTGPQQWGIYWSGRSGSGEAALYLEDAANNNKHFVTGEVVGKAMLKEFGWYDVDIQQIGLTSTGVFDNVLCDPKRGTAHACIMDTGTPVLVVPDQVFKTIMELYKSDMPLGFLTFTLAGVQAENGAAVVLRFDVYTLLKNNWITSGGDKIGTILGLPLWATYYTLVDIANSEVTFVSRVRSGFALDSPLQGSAEDLEVDATVTNDTGHDPLQDGVNDNGHHRRLEDDSPMFF